MKSSMNKRKQKARYRRNVFTWGSTLLLCATAGARAVVTGSPKADVVRAGRWQHEAR
ncbi:unnamed protein product, partial [Amoebophrya sp. A120]|eukprot:GSA120T00020284001.1